MISYYGDMTFLDDWSPFFSIFKEELALLSSTPINLSTDNVRDRIDDHANKCMFDVTLRICKLGYTGDTTKDSEN